MTKQLIWLVLLTAVSANILLTLDLPHTIQAITALLLTGVLPGVLAVELLVGRSASPPDPWEHALYVIGAGFTSMVTVMLLISYLPGPPDRWLVLTVYDGLLAALATVLLVRSDNTTAAGKSPWPSDVDWRWMLMGAISLLAVAALLRFTNLGYGDFQGDEARATLRAAAILQGYEDVLFIHKKGPTEILLPTVLYALTGLITEATARLPFAIANLAGIFGVWYLGWRLFNPLAGWIAAMFLALDGYFIGFSRIVQYQSVVFLMSILAVLLLYRVTQRPVNLGGYLTLAALLMATGVMSHYEAALATIPVAYFWGLLYQRDPSVRRELLVATALAGGMAAVLLAAFFAPYVVNPEFANTYTYLTERRIGGTPPYNNLADAFIRTTLYSTTYSVLLVIGLTVSSIVHIYWRYLLRTLALLFTLLLAVWVTATFWRSTWLSVGGYDLMGIAWLVFFGAVVLAPRLPHADRAIWLWFAVVGLLALFLTATPRTHIYTFFMPWMLLAGQFLALLWCALQNRLGRRLAVTVGIAAAATQILLFGNYAYQLFASPKEVMFNFQSQRPSGYWTAYDTPDYKAMFGFPLNHGWKAIGEMVRAGEITGSYESNEGDIWVPAWYVRSVNRCRRDAEWFFETRNLEPPSTREMERTNAYLQQGFEQWARIQVDGNDKLTVYRRSTPQTAPSAATTNRDLTYRAEDFTVAFDANSSPDLPLVYPIVPARIMNSLHVDFGGQIWLEGYDLSYAQPLSPGDSFYLTLYWRPQAALEENYKVFNQLRDRAGGMVAQLDGYPACDSYMTREWEPGELIVDRYEIQVKVDAEAGTYPLYTGLYADVTGERLPVQDVAGQVVDSEWHLANLTIGE